MSQLRVNGIANTGGTTAASIEANGIVTEPNKPAFHAYPTSAQGSAGIGAFNATLVNVNNCYSTSTYKFTAPITGNYFFTCTALPQSSSSTGFFRFRKNDVDIGPSNFIINPDESITTAVVLPLTVGDLVHVHFYANGFETSYTSFSGFLIG
jgi:hypothetical protein